MGQSQGGGGVGTGRGHGICSGPWEDCDGGWGLSGHWWLEGSVGGKGKAWRGIVGPGGRRDRFGGPGRGWVCLVLKTITQAGCPLQHVLESARQAAKREDSVNLTVVGEEVD